MIISKIKNVAATDVITCNAVDYTDVYVAGTNYPVGGLIGFGGIAYSSLQTPNTGNQPNTSPTFWKSAAFDIGFTYPKDVLTIYQGYIYISVQASNTGNQPDVKPAYWSKVKVANSYAMFDGEANTVTTRADSLNFKINAKSIDTISLINASAKTATIVVMKGAQTIINKTYDLAKTLEIQNIIDYCFGERQYRTTVVDSNVPIAGDVTVEITLENIGSTVSLGVYAHGRKIEVGDELLGLTLEPIDYSLVVQDKDGLTSITKQFRVKKYSSQSPFDTDKWDYIASKLEEILSTPCIVIGGEGLKDSLILYALINYKLVWQYQRTSFATINVTGLI